MRKPDGKGWISMVEMARMLGMRVKQLYLRMEYKRLPKVKVGRNNWFRREDVEAMLRDPERVRRMENWERKQTVRKQANAEGRREGLVDLMEAARRLSVSGGMVKRWIYSGRLTTFQEELGHSKHWLSEAEVEELRVSVEAKREMRGRRAEERKTLVTLFRTRATLKRGGTVEVGDLSVWERYLGEWVTTRQVAWMLRVTQRAVCSLRQSGRLVGREQETIIFGRVRWHYRKADVLALRNDAAYCKRRGTYDLYLSPIARALRAEGERAGEAREWTELERLNREGTGRQLVDEVLADRW